MHSTIVKLFPITPEFRAAHPYIICEPVPFTYAPVDMGTGEVEVMYCASLECAARTLEYAGPNMGRPDITHAAYVRDVRTGEVFSRGQVIGVLRFWDRECVR
jgi:hypothetical protein